VTSARAWTAEDRRQAPGTLDAMQAARLHRGTWGVVAVGLAITVLLSYGASLLHDSNERRLLAQRAREAATSLEANLASIQTPLVSAADLAEATDGDRTALAAQLELLVTAGQRFVSASVWRLDGSSLEPVVVVGSPPLLASSPPDEIRSVLRRAAASPRLAVFDLTSSDAPSLGYSVVSSTPDPTFVTYVERVLPPNRTTYVRDGEAFSGLDSAVYLGSSADPDKLLTASTPDLPLDGRTRAQDIPWGDTTLHLVVSPTGELAGGIAPRLWWSLLLAGGVVTVGMGALYERLLRGRARAEELAAENERLYAEQRTVSLALQHSLLPSVARTIGDLAFATLYQPASGEGVDIGGDWYDAIAVRDGGVMFVVGDVSGRGLPAATVMASMRYSIRAFASQGLPPASILTELNRLLDVDRDGHFATVVCGQVDVTAGRITLASAGHPPLLVIGAGSADFARPPVGPPIGVAERHAYTASTIEFERDATVVAYTDGLFERRGESIDEGLERLRSAAADASRPHDPAEVLTLIRDRLATSGEHDDTAMLALAWASA